MRLAHGRRRRGLARAERQQPGRAIGIAASAEEGIELRIEREQPDHILRALPDEAAEEGQSDQIVGLGVVERGGRGEGEVARRRISRPVQQPGLAAEDATQPVAFLRRDELPDQGPVLLVGPEAAGGRADAGHRLRRLVRV